MSIQTIAQERAKHALDQVNKWQDYAEKDQKELKSYVVGFPAMILISGFGQTCAFYKSKGGNHDESLAALASWLKQQTVFSSDDVMAEIVKSTAKQYQLAEAESLEYLSWLKKFTKAYLQGESND